MKLTQRKWKTGSAWVMDYRVDGVRRRRTLHGVESREDALKLAKAIFREMAQDEILADMAPRAAAKRKVERGEARRLGEWLEEDRKRAGIARATAVMECGRAKKLCTILGATRYLGDIDATLMQQYAAQREREGAKARTVNMELQLLQAALNRGVALGVIGGGKRSFKRLPEERPRRRFLSPKEVDAIMGAMERTGKVPQWFRWSVTMLLHTGMRRSELFALTWDRVDFERKEIRVQTRKRGARGHYKEHVLPLNAAAMTVLKQMRPTRGNGTGLVFGRESIVGEGKRERTNFGTLLKRVAEEAGVSWSKELRVHDLRHAFAMRLLESGVNMKVLAGLMRHSSPSITLEVYCHDDEGRMREAVEGLCGTEGDGGMPQNGRKKKEQSAKILDVV